MKDEFRKMLNSGLENRSSTTFKIPNPNFQNPKRAKNIYHLPFAIRHLSRGAANFVLSRFSSSRRVIKM